MSSALAMRWLSITCLVATDTMWEWVPMWLVMCIAYNTAHMVSRETIPCPTRSDDNDSVSNRTGRGSRANTAAPRATTARSQQRPHTRPPLARGPPEMQRRKAMRNGCNDSNNEEKKTC